MLDYLDIRASYEVHPCFPARVMCVVDDTIAPLCIDACPSDDSSQTVAPSVVHASSSVPRMITTPSTSAFCPQDPDVQPLPSSHGVLSSPMDLSPILPTDSPTLSALQLSSITLSDDLHSDSSSIVGSPRALLQDLRARRADEAQPSLLLPAIEGTSGDEHTTVSVVATPTSTTLPEETPARSSAPVVSFLMARPRKCSSVHCNRFNTVAVALLVAPLVCLQVDGLPLSHALPEAALFPSAVVRVRHPAVAIQPQYVLLSVPLQLVSCRWVQPPTAGPRTRSQTAATDVAMIGVPASPVVRQSPLFPPQLSLMKARLCRPHLTSPSVQPATQTFRPLSRDRNGSVE